MNKTLKTYTAIIEKCPDTGLYIGYIPGIKGAHTQAETLEELQSNLIEVLSLISESGKLQSESKFIGTQNITVPLYV